MSKSDMDYLDRWVTEGDRFHNSPEVIIGWLRVLPIREKVS